MKIRLIIKKKRWRHLCVLLEITALLQTPIGICAQSIEKSQDTHYTEVGTDIIYLSTLTPNINFEVGLSPHWSISLLSGFNPVKFSVWTNDDGKQVNPKLLHWSVAPELKYWVNTKTRHNHWGVHLIYGQYNVGGVCIGMESMLCMPFVISQHNAGLGNFLSTSIRDNRYEGWCVGGGISWGYRFYPTSRLRFDVSVGLGYIYFDYNKYKSYSCGPLIRSETYHYLGPTKISLMLSYVLK